MTGVDEDDSNDEYNDTEDSTFDDFSWETNHNSDKDEIPDEPNNFKKDNMGIVQMKHQDCTFQVGYVSSIKQVIYLIFN